MALTCNVMLSPFAFVFKLNTGEITQFTPAGDQVPTLFELAVKVNALTALLKVPENPLPEVAVLSRSKVNDHVKMSPVTIEVPTELVACVVPETTTVVAAWAGAVGITNPRIAITMNNATRCVEPLDFLRLCDRVSARVWLESIT